MRFLTDIVLGVSVVVWVSRRCEQPVSAHCFSDRNVKLTRRDFSRTTFLEISVLKRLSNHCFFFFQCIHKDVAARNIRLGNKSVAKVTNIGCSCVTYEDISAVSLK